MTFSASSDESTVGFLEVAGLDMRHALQRHPIPEAGNHLRNMRSVVPSYTERAQPGPIDVLARMRSLHRALFQIRTNCPLSAAPIVLPKGRNATNYFCSQAHANEWQGRNKDAYTCKTCGKEFRWSKSRIASRPARRAAFLGGKVADRGEDGA